MRINRFVEWICPKMNSVQYYKELNSRIDEYRRIYDHDCRKASFRLAIWNFMQLLFLAKEPKRETFVKEEDRKGIRVAFMPTGGIGDILLFANYLYYFKEKYCDSIIDVYFLNKSAKFVFREGYIVDSIYDLNEKSIVNEQYDLVIRLMRFPEVVYYNDRIHKVNPELVDYIFKCKEFRIFNRRFFETGPSCDGQSAYISLYNNRNRLQQADIYGLLGIKEYKYDLLIENDSEKILEKYGLVGGNL